MRLVNAPRPPAGGEDERLFPEEGPSGGCASGECLPDVEPEAAVAAAPAPTGPAPTASADVRPAGAAPAPAVQRPAPTGPPVAAPGPGADSRASGPLRTAPAAQAQAPQRPGADPAGLTAPRPSPAAPAPAGPRPAPAPSATTPSATTPSATAPAAAASPAAAAPAARPAAPMPPAGAPGGGPRPAPSAPAPAPGAAAREAPSGYQATRWRAAVEAVRAVSARHGASLAHSRLLFMRPGSVGVGFTRDAAFHRTAVTSPTGKALIERALAEHWGQPTQLLVEQAEVAPEAAGPSLAESDAREKAEYERSTDGQVRNHPAVRSALRFLGGEIEHIQVLERERPAPAPDAPEDPG